MAYEKHTWACGEAITTEKLNHMEDGIASGGSAGFECIENGTLVTLVDNNTITTTVGEAGNTASFSYGAVDAGGRYPTINVTLEGELYENVPLNEDYSYGAPYDDSTDAFDWSTYPFNIYGYSIVMQYPGTYTVNVDASIEKVEVTDCFRKAVTYGAFIGALWVNAIRRESSSINLEDFDVENSDVYDAFVKGVPIYVYVQAYHALGIITNAQYFYNDSAESEDEKDEYLFTVACKSSTTDFNEVSLWSFRGYGTAGFAYGRL